MCRILSIVSTLLAISLTACTVVYFKKSYQGPKVVDFTTGVFVVNKVEASSKEIAAMLEGQLINGLLTLTDSVKGISSLNLPEAQQQDDIYHDLPTLLTAVRLHSDAMYLVDLMSYSPNGGAGFAIGDVEIDNGATLTLAIFRIETGENIYRLTVTAEEERFSNDGTGLVFTKSNEKMLGRALKKTLNELKKNAQTLKIK